MEAIVYTLEFLAILAIPALIYSLIFRKLSHLLRRKMWLDPATVSLSGRLGFRFFELVVYVAIFTVLVASQSGGFDRTWFWPGAYFVIYYLIYWSADPFA